MKNQINRILVMFFVTGFILLATGCPSDPSQNNQNNTNLNTSNENTANQEEIPDDTAKTEKPCTSITEKEIQDEINSFPESLRKQFEDGTISFSFADNVLTFKGFVHGKGNNLRTLLYGFDKYRSPQCIKVISLKGDSDAARFQWRPQPGDPTPTNPPAGCKDKIKEVFDKSKIFPENSKNFSYSYNEQTGVLDFKGYIHEQRGKGGFTSLIQQLDGFMDDGCITKIVFIPPDKEGGNQFNSGGFDWMLCEAGQCECAGVCGPCPCAKEAEETTKSSDAQ